MTLPNFLGIGAQRAGSSWLDKQLRSHPKVYIPARRKEVHFFDRYYDRGLEWYQEFFPSAERASQYRAIGEITPMYIYHPDMPARIQKHMPDCKFIAILRNPADRAYSHYNLMVRGINEQRSFDKILKEYPKVYARGLYSEQLERYLRYFPRKNMLVLIFEHIKSDSESVLHQIAEFLSIDASKFKNDLVEKKVNVSSLPRFPRARAMAIRFRGFLWRKDLDWVVNVFRAMGARHLFGNRGSMPPMSPDMRATLLAKYEPDIASLEELLKKDLSLWTKPPN